MFRLIIIKIPTSLSLARLNQNKLNCHDITLSAGAANTTLLLGQKTLILAVPIWLVFSVQFCPLTFS